MTLLIGKSLAFLGPHLRTIKLKCGLVFSLSLPSPHSNKATLPLLHQGFYTASSPGAGANACLLKWSESPLCFRYLFPLYTCQGMAQDITFHLEAGVRVPDHCFTGPASPEKASDHDMMEVAQGLRCICMLGALGSRAVSVL